MASAERAAKSNATIAVNAAAAFVIAVVFWDFAAVAEVTHVAIAFDKIAVVKVALTRFEPADAFPQQTFTSKTTRARFARAEGYWRCHRGKFASCARWL